MLKWNLGWVMRKNKPMENSKKENLHLQFSDEKKTGNPNFGGVINLKIFHMIDIKEMAAIFQFFHNGQH